MEARKEIQKATAFLEKAKHWVESGKDAQEKLLILEGVKVLVSFFPGISAAVDLGIDQLEASIQAPQPNTTA